MRLLWLIICVSLSLPALADVPAGWFPFVISELAPGSVCNVAPASPVPAGQNGFVTVRDGRFVDGKGQRLRFLGTNVTFATAFPDKELAPRIAARMASLGINCVRFHHMDNAFTPRGIWDPAFKDHQHLDAGQLDRLDWFIYQLKQQGIYVNLNLHVSRTLDDSDGFPNSKLLPNYNKGVDNFAAGMIAMQKNYARDLLTHTNPYTKTQYVNEPCVALVEMNNENSLLGFAFDRTLHDLPEPYISELRGYWIDYLKSRYQNTEQLRRAWDEGSEPLGQELLRNQDLSQGTKEFVLETRHPGEDVFEVVQDPEVGKALHARLVKPGTNSWDFQIHQVGHSLEAGKLYTVSFRIKADPKREVYIGARYDVADWRSIGLDARVTADSQWRAYQFTFRARDPKPDHNRISFNCQNTLGDVWLADLSLKPGGLLGLPPDQSLEAGTVLFPTSSSTTRARRDWFAFIMDLERKYTSGMYDYLKKDLKLHANVIDTQDTYGGLGGAWRESQLDYIDAHAYWQHPSFPGKPWDGGNWLIANTPMTAALGRDTLTGLARYRIFGKPFTVSEYNHPAPGDCRAEGIPMAASFAGLQDWDGIFQFDYGSTPADWTTARVQGYFQMVTDPAPVAFFPVAANLFIRGDMSPARGLAVLWVPGSEVANLLAEDLKDSDRVWTKYDVPRETSITRRIALQWTKAKDITADRVKVPEGNQQQSDTGQLLWRGGQDDSLYRVDTPKTKVALGHIAGQTLKIGDLAFDLGPTSNRWAAVALTSMDDLPLTQSKRMLLVVMSRVENQNMGWSADRRTVGKAWGTGPTIAEAVPVKLTMPGRKLVAYALDGTGARQQELPATADSLDLNAPTVWYEITTR
ncbi:MAG: carbohydrate binding domain-containing protein [Armatimonadia bacterium]